MPIPSPGTNDGRRRGYTHSDRQAGWRLPAEHRREQQSATRRTTLAVLAAAKVETGFEAADR